MKWRRQVRKHTRKEREGGEIQGQRKLESRLHILRERKIATSVMCADARTRGNSCYGPTDTAGPALPVLDEDLECYYQHARNYLDKIRQDLKDVGAWDVDPRITAGMGAGKKQISHHPHSRDSSRGC